ncbi:hypothetical protein BB560_004774 [Smittium megazygosporum]|uniref:Cleavage and polyadenylation specificity factor subunit 5 n=1 Tax=Smittium megazygosporum TaxID=133381 RepID=A0A2T9Z8A2_9FUNG|nr:hypothetical protein BB560_004774 [Smittium megazygosporum]
MSRVRVYPLENYTISVKSAQYDEETSMQAKMKALQQYYEVNGTRISVEGILIVKERGFPHVLLLHVANAFFRLPGGSVSEDEVVNKYGENGTSGEETLESGSGMGESSGFNLGYGHGPNELEKMVLRKSLNKHLAALRSDDMDETEVMDMDWQIGEQVATWYRPHFEQYMYPYLPAHISSPKEIRKFFVVQLPEQRKLVVPKNMNLVAVPLFELYENSSKYGAQYASLPQILSRFDFS